MIVGSSDEMRAAIEEMASRNKVSVTVLNNLSGVGQGVLTRYMRKFVPRRIGGKLVEETTEADIKVGVLLRVIEAAGYELEIRPRETRSRRDRLRSGRRAGMAGGGE